MDTKSDKARSKSSRRPWFSAGIAVMGIVLSMPVSAADAAAPVAPNVECAPGTKSSATAEVKTEPVTVSATGYGAPPPKYYPENQRRLMSMRASKLDAYRALAETINGLHIWGGTTLGDMVVQKDRYRVFLDAFVRGARIVSVTAGEDGNYETVVEVTVDQGFFNRVLAEPTVAPCQTGSEQITFAPLETPSTFYYSE